MWPFKVEFDTVRTLEKKTYSVFAYAGTMFALGAVLSIIGLVVLGIPLLLIGGFFLLLAIVWVSLLGKEPTISVFCPYCACTNDVYKSRRSFRCDMCDRPIALNEDGQPEMPLDGVFGGGD